MSTPVYAGDPLLSVLPYTPPGFTSVQLMYLTLVAGAFFALPLLRLSTKNTPTFG